MFKYSEGDSYGKDFWNINKSRPSSGIHAGNPEIGPFSVTCLQKYRLLGNKISKTERELSTALVILQMCNKIKLLFC